MDQAGNHQKLKKTRTNCRLPPSKVKLTPPPLLLTNHQPPSPWKMQLWPNALPAGPGRKSTSAGMRRRPTIVRPLERWAPSSWPSSPPGCPTTSWCWSTPSVRTASHPRCGRWGTGSATSTAPSTPSAMPSATRPSGPPSETCWCVSGGAAGGTHRRRRWCFRRGSRCENLVQRTLQRVCPPEWEDPELIWVHLKMFWSLKRTGSVSGSEAKFCQSFGLAHKGSYLYIVVVVN